ncbi:MAG TPA: HEAT repeat domain-containing protein [Acidobacteriaceae bacterium]|nr:HEAT repeat domain-containing protein [Acidobacteriaceae bacterium]
MRYSLLALALLAAAPVAQCSRFPRGQTQLICHRTANEDMPENTLESLALAARMGCNVVEIDLTRTLDGEIVLHHDGLLERLSNGMGVVEQTYSEELALLDAGSWMGSRFGVLRIPRFADALRLAREQGIELDLDLKSKGIGAEVVSILKREGMLEKVRFGGEWEDVLAADPTANQDPIVSFSGEVTREQVDQAHREGKYAVVSFVANPHAMDLDAMRAAVAAGADGIGVDYPRLGADAVGRPVEAKIAALAVKAGSGSASDRAAAILELSYFEGFPTEPLFLRSLLNSDDRISRAAAIALVTSHPPVREPALLPALAAPQPEARKNAAWAIGISGGRVVPPLLALLHDPDPRVLEETLLALSRCHGEVPAQSLLPFLSHPSPLIRGAAALALVRHQPGIAARAIPAALKRDEQSIAEDYARYVQRGKPKLSQQEIDPIVVTYRGQMKMIQAGEDLPSPQARAFLEAEASRSVEDYSRVGGLVAGYQLWDRIGRNPQATLRALASADFEVADRAQWILAEAGPEVLPAVRKALESGSPAVRERCARILAWQGDFTSLPLLRHAAGAGQMDSETAKWAIERIKVLIPLSGTTSQTLSSRP